jgi:hypothetical protein
MLDRLKYALINLRHLQKWILIQTFDGEYCVDILTEIHPFDSFLARIRPIHIINIMDLVEFVVSQDQTHSTENSLELISCNYIFSEVIKI